jgi:hypothetical protein
MRRESFVGLVGMVALAGCAQPPVVASQAAAVRSSDGGGRFDESAQLIAFDAGDKIDAVDVHLTIDDTSGRTRVANVRMARGSDGGFVAGPLALQAGDHLAFWFTTLAAGVGHDTAGSGATVSAGFQPTALRPEIATSGGGFVARLVSARALDWSDLHYTVNGGPEADVRMTAASDGWSLPLVLPASSTIDYWMTYSVGGMVFDSGRSRYQAGATSGRLPWVDSLFVADSSQGTPAGCARDGDGYRCDPYAFSQIVMTGGYHIEGDVTLAPFSITNTGPYGEALLKTVRLRYQYVGELPRTGGGVVLLPTSASHPGLPPTDEADGAAGKAVAPAWTLHAGYLVGGDSLGVALVDTLGVRGNVVDIVAHRSSYCRYGCSLDVPVAQLANGTSLDLDRIRYVAFVTEDDATVDQWVTVTDLSFGPPLVFGP